MQTISTRIPARTAAAQAAIVRALSGDPTPAQAPTVAANALNWHQHHTATPEPMAIPPMPAVSEIESEADEPSEAMCNNPFEAMMPAIARAAQPAANNDDVADAESSDDQEHENPDASRLVRGDARRKLSRIVGPRLVRARALSGYTQTEAATALGYSTPAQVSLWEMGRRLPPIFELIKISEIYSVSLDYLMGASHEPDRDPSAGTRHAVLRGVRNMLSQVAELTAGEIDRHVRLLGPSVSNVRGMLENGDALVQALGAFMRHGGDAFGEMRGSATLQRLSSEFEATLAEARAAIRLHDARDADLTRALAALGDADPLLADDDEWMA
jgi:transcriptional regulator with XRE-family HTH domain